MGNTIYMQKNEQNKVFKKQNMQTANEHIKSNHFIGHQENTN